MPVPRTDFWFRASAQWVRALRVITVMGTLVAGLGPALGEPPVTTRTPFVTQFDHPCDSAPRPTDPDRLLPFDPQSHRLIELVDLTLGRWAPASPQADLFAGQYASNGEFVRLSLVLDGLVNPPGSTNPSTFNPFAFGPHPVYGFIEVDVDNDAGTGGEVDAPEYRYLGNIARLGGKPAGLEYLGRIALSDAAFDGTFLTPPFVERHGEEFHLAFLGGLFGVQDITVVVGDGDSTFEANETWNITAPLFHRAHGYEPFSFADGGSYAGEYSPDVTVQFQHADDPDQTRVSLVFPLTNDAAAAVRGEAPEPDNADPSDQASLLEALLDLNDSALFLSLFPTGFPEEALIAPWENKEPSDYLDPTVWRVTALLGTSYTAPDPAGERFVWTDAYPNALRGDMDGDGAPGVLDRTLILQYLALNDAADGEVDGRAVISDFADGFSIFDVNQDGQVAAIDVDLVSRPGDLDDDNDLDLIDFSGFQACGMENGQSPGWAACALADLDADGDVDLVDAERFLLDLSVSGP